MLNNSNNNTYNNINSTKISDFIILSQIGKGAFGTVYLVKRKLDNKIYALKKIIIEKMKKKEIENSLNEIRILASISHPNIISYKEVFWDDDSNSLNIVMEYADDGDLSKKIIENKRNKIPFSEKKIWSFSIQIVEGLKYLHNKRIIHRDLKSANIFLMKNGIIKIGDLNVSKILKNKTSNNLHLTQTGHHFTPVQKYGATNHIHIKVICGLWDVSYMKCVPIILLLWEKTWMNYIEVLLEGKLTK